MTQQASAFGWNFDPTQYDIWGGAAGNVIKQAGLHRLLVMITNAEITPTKDGSSYKTVFTLEVIDGQFKNQLIDDTLNTHNKSPEATQNALKQLASYCTAIGHSQAFGDANVLYRRPFQIELEAVQEADQKDANKKYWRNTVKQWFYANGEPIVHGLFATPAQQQPVLKQQHTAPAVGGSPAPAAAPQAAPAPATAPTPQAAPAFSGTPAAQAGQYAPPAQGGYAAPQGQVAPPQGGVTIAQNAPPQGGAPAFSAPPAAGFQPPQ